MKPSLFLILLAALAPECVASSVTVTTTTLPNGMVTIPYSVIIAASGGCTPYKWAIASGALPAGVTATVSATTKALNLSGLPTTAATYSFTETVTGCRGHVSQVLYRVVIQAAANHVVDLSWTASTSDNVAGYNVYRSPDAANWKEINAGLIGSTAYDDSAVADGTIYYYAATAVDIYGRESNKTTAIKAVIP